ncbi:hypothetical protein RhiLY_03905 [Ceratobasidium sp. AG-Ba]|nr:hypothetical protein RhiLY_03905 [Ceratobasidium sp. AG-Ba]
MEGPTLPISSPPPLYSEDVQQPGIESVLNDEQPLIVVTPPEGKDTFQSGFLGSEGDISSLEGEVVVKGGHLINGIKLRLPLGQKSTLVPTNRARILQAYLWSQTQAPSTSTSPETSAMPPFCHSPSDSRLTTTMLTHPNSAISNCLIVTLESSSLPPISKTVEVHTRRYTTVTSPYLPVAPRRITLGPRHPSRPKFLERYFALGSLSLSIGKFPRQMRPSWGVAYVCETYAPNSPSTGPPPAFEDGSITPIVGADPAAPPPFVEGPGPYEPPPLEPSGSQLPTFHESESRANANGSITPGGSRLPTFFESESAAAAAAASPSREQILPPAPSGTFGEWAQTGNEESGMELVFPGEGSSYGFRPQDQFDGLTLGLGSGEQGLPTDPGVSHPHADAVLSPDILADINSDPPPPLTPGADAVSNLAMRLQLLAAASSDPNESAPPPPPPMDDPADPPQVSTIISAKIVHTQLGALYLLPPTPTSSCRWRVATIPQSWSYSNGYWSTRIY